MVLNFSCILGKGHLAHELIVEGSLGSRNWVNTTSASPAFFLINRNQQ